MAAYRREVDDVAGHFKGYQVEHIDRMKNRHQLSLRIRNSQIFLCWVLDRQIMQHIQEDIGWNRFTLGTQAA